MPQKVNRDKPAFTDAIIEIAADKVLSNKDAVLVFIKQGLIYPKPTKADEKYVAILMTELRKAGEIQTRQSQREDRKHAIYRFAERMHPVGVRQVAYHLSSKGLIEKKEQDFENVCNIIGDMREDGELPWEWVFDNTAITLPHASNPLSIPPTALLEPNVKRLRRYPNVLGI